MFDYEVRKDEEGEQIGCESCGYLAPLGEFKDMTGLEHRKTHYFCEICSSTHISKTVVYPKQFVDVKLAQSLGWIANRIIDEIRKA